MLQLSLKPQKSTNWLYTATGNYSEYSSDNTLFGSLGASYNDTTNSIVPHLDSTAANIPNGTWQAYHQTGSSKTSLAPQLFAVQRSQVGAALPVPFSGVKACGSSATSSGNNGIYQRIYGLEDEKTYNLQFTLINPLSPDSNSVITLYDLTSNTDQTFTALQTGTNTYSLEFEANGTTADVVINIFSKVNECFYIKKASVQEHYTDVEYTFSDFEDGSVDVDLFDDSIPLILSISSFTDATSNLQSHSKDFKLPSTKNNDKIFTHIYDLNSSIEGNANSFNPYVKTVATLKEDGIEIFTGELTLNSINKNKEGITYDVNLQSRVSGLAGVLKNRKLEDLDFSSLNHDYTSTNIKSSWTTGLTLADGTISTDIKYPFVNWTGNILDPNLDGDLQLDKLEDAFRPFIRIKYLFDKIFTAAGFDYDSSFMNSVSFTKLFMDLNHGEENGASIGSASEGEGQFIIEADQNDSTRWFTNSWTKFRLTETDNPSIYNNSQLADAYWDSTTYSLKPLSDNTTIDLHAQLQMFNETNSTKNVGARTIHEKLDGTKEVIHQDGFGISGSPFSDPSESYTPNISVTLRVGEQIYFEGKTDTATSNVVRQEISGDGNSYNSTWVKVSRISSEIIGMTALLRDSRGDISQWKFVKSIMNMFNLVVSPNEGRPNLLTIEPYDSVFGLEGFGNAIDDPQFSGLLDSGITTNAGVTAQLNAAGDLQVATNGTATVSYASMYYPYVEYVDGETYTAKIVVEGFTTGNSFKFAVQRNGGNEYDQVISSSGEYEFSFVFDKSTNGGSNNLRVRLYMLNAQTNVATLRISELSVVGKFENTIVKKDWSDKVDVDSFDIKMMNLDKQINFGFSKDKGDFTSNVYSESIPLNDNTPYRYGDLVYKASAYTSLTSIDRLKLSPFASTIVKPLNYYAPLNRFVVPAIYTKKSENEFSVYKNKPRLLYDNGVVTTTAKYSSPSQNADVGFTDESDYLQFTTFSEFDSYSGSGDDALDLNWTNCQAFVDNNSIKGLFNEYWGSYYDELYHPDTRIYSVNVLLNNNDVVNFSFTDLIIIENSQFRVNNINYNAGGISKVELIKIP